MRQKYEWENWTEEDELNHLTLEQMWVEDYGDAPKHLKPRTWWRRMKWRIEHWIETKVMERRKKRERQCRKQDE